MSLQPTFVREIQAENSRLAEEGLPPTLPRTKAIVKMWATACPRLTEALQREGILEATANVLDDRVLTLARSMPGEYSEARQVAERELLPFDQDSEQQFLSQHTTT